MFTYLLVYLLSKYLLTLSKYFSAPFKGKRWYFFEKWSKILQNIIMKVHSPSFKALENPWTVTFKRYFLGHFVDNSDIFTTAIIGPGRDNFDSPVSYFLFMVTYSHSLVIIFVHFLSPCPPFCQLQLKLCQDATLVADTSWENERKWWVQSSGKEQQLLLGYCYYTVALAVLPPVDSILKTTIEFSKNPFLIF